MLKKIRLKSKDYILEPRKQHVSLLFLLCAFWLFSVNVWADVSASSSNPSTANPANQSSSNTSNSSSSAQQNAPNTTSSPSASDQEDLTKLFDHAKYEDFAKQKPIGGFSLPSSEPDNGAEDGEGAP